LCEAYLDEAKRSFASILPRFIDILALVANWSNSA
jgi:hypothetical protein